MSLEQAKASIEKMKTDRAFLDRIMAIADVKERVAAINNEFICSVEEMKQLHNDYVSCHATVGVSDGSDVVCSCEGGGTCKVTITFGCADYYVGMNR